MKKHIIVLLSCCLLTSFAFSQTIPQLVNEVNLDSLVKTVSEFAGEVPTVVNGNTVTILNRQQANNDLAADYLVQKLQRLDNLTVVNQPFNTNGHNIIATQIGKTNPNNIYIVSAHYDSVTNYCADDNASGVATVLEIARLLSTQCLDNTIVYALWDEEENGLNGSAYYANQAYANGDTILGVLNIDMMAYDGNNDMNFDIDVRNYANSLGMKDDILSILNNPTYGFSLVVNVVDPGTLDSDHASFWNKQYSAVLVGESWITNDHTPHYHMATDRLADFNLPYYHQLAKLIFGYMVTKAGLVAIDNTISATATTLTAAQNSASYQWYNCDTNLPIDGETAQSFSPNSNGSYAVEVTSGSCSEMSECFFFETLAVSVFADDEVKVYPNPVQSFLKVDTSIEDLKQLKLYAISGKLLLSKETTSKSIRLDVKQFPKGIYFLSVKTKDKSGTYKIVKE